MEQTKDDKSIKVALDGRASVAKKGKKRSTAAVFGEEEDDDKEEAPTAPKLAPPVLPDKDIIHKEEHQTRKCEEEASESQVQNAPSRREMIKKITGSIVISLFDTQDGGDILQLDQDDLETVVPKETGKKVWILDGRYRGGKATLVALDKK
jgi:hypothetical protein